MRYKMQWVVYLILSMAAGGIINAMPPAAQQAAQSARGADAVRFSRQMCPADHAYTYTVTAAGQTVTVYDCEASR